eukprot:TRINITY_DN64_c0_g5_i2.p1 TRINITY_DN64_c0_g5~~TRINITY_DN64_c0_g5_i2.p1  ORF type:complete len:345 (-),score=95.14 TRINITY_DN64_c0_g5_i2:56-1090(-)
MSLERDAVVDQLQVEINRLFGTVGDLNSQLHREKEANARLAQEKARLLELVRSQNKRAGGQRRESPRSPSARPVFTDKGEYLMQKLQFPVSFSQRVDMTKVNVVGLQPWVSEKLAGLLGVEDDVLVGFVLSELQKKDVDPRRLLINLTAFLEDKAMGFMIELWDLLLLTQFCSSDDDDTPGVSGDENSDVLQQKLEQALKSLSEVRGELCAAQAAKKCAEENALATVEASRQEHTKIGALYEQRLEYLRRQLDSSVFPGGSCSNSSISTMPLAPAPQLPTTTTTHVLDAVRKSRSVVVPPKDLKHVMLVETLAAKILAMRRALPAIPPEVPHGQVLLEGVQEEW